MWIFAYLSTQPVSVTLVRNIPLMRQQNTDIGWNELILRCYALILHDCSYSQPIHICLPCHYIMVLHYMSVPTLRISNKRHNH